MSSEAHPTDTQARGSGRKNRGNGSRRDILDAAARLFQQKGYDATSLRELANAVGMKAGSLYYHFASKEQLAIEVLAIGVKAVTDNVSAHLKAAGPGVTPQQRVSIAIRAHLESILSDGGYTSAHIRCFPYTPEAVQSQLRTVRRTYEDIWTGLIDDLAGLGERPEEARHIRLATLGALNWSLEWFDAERDDMEDYARTVERLIIGASGNVNSG
ncbi:TetR/AcrR family transcriptional regulator [Hoeflea prorocentri]|uniref:TetR/AcrR family transcriptional regulator n=1 Tax=Hoeflea prorocentri TaxID=1922333 RepID=A0A9X3UHN8_9HYPH|nr:TetR/AcrR family transcriptional regulator [Hoeflea prorocentri]MCY6381588.1 TetR/AcrR family transcriptional regulator [Hoeflea prorocentri]MDA5399388.1 TetR/AcrR family transcriptional regulator [Hoeflea prorocentri]